MKEDLRIRLMLSLQVALLGAITPNIRAITCSINEKGIVILAIFDSVINDDDIDSMESVASEVASHFESLKVFVECKRLDAPVDFRPQALDLWVYRRKES
ncbi:hypothetical protein PTE30175_05339 [Pandoraea terrae]|uniref:Uncharacterized protein n=1 Tax=Pandoraea terrae TaxID=1537710 RepID=A0A5E4ZCI2_9BURK|nr:hypothetical protein [Pandoraea terrae]VVE58979.1 hypothetical protein PTE30175_05339 [Pandoraea terrae]